MAIILNTSEITFQHRVQVLYAGLISGLLFSLIGTGSALLPWFDSDTSREIAIGISLFIGACWSLMLFLSFYIIASYFRHRLCLNDHAISQQDVFGRRTIPIESTVEVQWRSDALYERIELQGRYTKIRINLFNYSQVEQQHIIAFFRKEFLPEVQTGWTEFKTGRQEKTKVPKERAAESNGFLYITLTVVLVYWFLLA